MPRMGFGSGVSVGPAVHTRPRIRVGMVAFNKHIAVEMESRLAGARVLLDGSDEQKQIWDVLLNQDKHVIVEAVAGSGKTTTLMQYCFRENAQVDAMTYHSLGYRTVKAAMRHGVRVDQYKVLGLLDTLTLPVSDSQQRMAKYRISSMVGFCKTYGFGPDVTREQMEEIAERHDVELNGLGELVMDYTPKVLQRCLDETRSVDFDDMVWLPYVLNLQPQKYDVLCVDEYQDTGHTQQWLAVHGGNRVVAVGDERQSIYLFRGADGTGFHKLRKELGASNVITLPLTLTRRCPKSHVKLAQQIVPQITALDHAPDGIITVTRTVDEGLDMMRPGDLALCRVNGPLVSTAYKLLKRGVKAVVRGRDIGQGIVKLVEQAEKREGYGVGLPEIVKGAGEITAELCAKFRMQSHGRGEMKAVSAEDKYSCLCTLAEGCGTVTELKAMVERLFAEFEDDGTPKHAVVLGTVHRTKGLEAGRVFVLQPGLIPHPKAKNVADQLQEMNLGYVAVTRAKFDDKLGLSGELVFVGGMCPLFSSENDNYLKYADELLPGAEKVEILTGSINDADPEPPIIEPTIDKQHRPRELKGQKERSKRSKALLS